MTTQSVRILIVDDHAVVRKGLAMVLNLEPDFEIVGEAENGLEAVALAQQLQPDLILLDFVMPKMDGEAAVPALRRVAPQAKLLILTGVELNDRVLQLLTGSVDGYVIKNIEPAGLIEAIRTVLRGEAYLHPNLARRLLSLMSRQQTDEPPLPHLTPRETEVLKLMATPATYRQIAEQLVVSEETIRSHAKNILNKLQQPNRAQAVLAAVRAGLIDLPE